MLICAHDPPASCVRPSEIRNKFSLFFDSDTSHTRRPTSLYARICRHNLGPHRGVVEEITQEDSGETNHVNLKQNTRGQKVRGEFPCVVTI